MLTERTYLKSEAEKAVSYEHKKLDRLERQEKHMRFCSTHGLRHNVPSKC